MAFALRSFVASCMLTLPLAAQGGPGHGVTLEAGCTGDVIGVAGGGLRRNVVYLDDLEKDNAENWSQLGHARAMSGLGDEDRASARLDRAYAERSSMLALCPGVDARMDRLRSDPRFAELRRRIGLPR